MATPASAVALGLLAVVAFSFSFPMTRVADQTLNPLVVGFGRGALGGVVAVAILIVGRATRPTRVELPSLLFVAGGVVIGFPVLTSLALQTVDAAHGSVINGILPLATGLVAVLLTKERRPREFWIAGVVGSLAVVAFAFRHGAGGLQGADLLLLAAVVLGALGYAHGGRLARHRPSWQVICWGLALALPVTVVGFGSAATAHGFAPSPASLGALLYLALISQVIGFFAWYHALAVGGIARIGQLQLIQSPLSLVWASLLLGEVLEPGAVLTMAVVLVAVVAGQRASQRASPRPASIDVRVVAPSLR